MYLPPSGTLKQPTDSGNSVFGSQSTACGYMDQTPLQNVDIVKNLETTLTILNHKLKHGVRSSAITKKFRCW